MLVLITATSGSGRKDYLEKVRKYALKHNKKIKIYNVGEMIFEQAEKIGIYLTHENVLNAHPSVISSVRSAVFEKITSDLPHDLKNNDAVIINIHAVFYWKKVFTRAWDNYYISQMNPDVFVTLIDNAKNVLFNLKSRKQWEKSKLNSKEILLWQNVELEMTAGWAEMKKRPFYIILSASSPVMLFRLLFKPNMERVYVSMPLTHFSSPKGQKIIDRFIKKLEEYFIIFDPRAIEPIFDQKAAKTGSTMFYQIVNRDFWLIRQSHRVIAYFPKPILSPGVINELREAHETNKESWLIFPKGKPISPFLSYYSNRIFRSPGELFNYLAGNHKSKNLKT